MHENRPDSDGSTKVPGRAPSFAGRAIQDCSQYPHFSVFSLSPPVPHPAKRNITKNIQKQHSFHLKSNVKLSTAGLVPAKIHPHSMLQLILQRHTANGVTMLVQRTRVVLNVWK